MSDSWSDWATLYAANRDKPARIVVLRPAAPAVADLEAHRAALCLQVVQLEDRLAVAHRRLARQQATIRRLRRRGPRPHEWLLACLVCLLDAADKRMRGWGL